MQSELRPEEGRVGMDGAQTLQQIGEPRKCIAIRIVGPRCVADEGASVSGRNKYIPQ